MQTPLLHPWPGRSAGRTRRSWSVGHQADAVGAAADDARPAAAVVGGRVGGRRGRVGATVSGATSMPGDVHAPGTSMPGHVHAGGTSMPGHVHAQGHVGGGRDASKRPRPARRPGRGASVWRRVAAVGRGSKARRRRRRWSASARLKMPLPPARVVVGGAIASPPTASTTAPAASDQQNWNHEAPRVCGMRYHTVHWPEASRRAARRPGRGDERERAWRWQRCPSRSRSRRSARTR